MPKSPNKLTRFWLELKRRKVFGVVATYAATAYIIIEVTNNLAVPLNLPVWVSKVILLLLVAGLPVTIILSWIFDITPAGIKKTESMEEAKKEEPEVFPSRRRLKASYLLNAVLLIIVIAIVCWEIFRPTPLERLQSSDKRLAIAVMPFRNMTNDTTWNVWQEGIQNSLISTLSNIGDLTVRQQESINRLLNSKSPVEYAAISQSVAGIISKKLDADIFIYGDILKGGSRIRLNAQMVDTKTRDVLKSIEIDGPYQEEIILNTIDSLKKKVTESLLISKLIRKFNSDGIMYTNITNPQTKSSEAYKYYIYGKKAFVKGDRLNAIEWYQRALKADSTYFDPALELAWAYDSNGMKDSCLQQVIKNYNKLDQWTTIDQLRAKCNYAYYFEPPEVGIKILEQVLELDDQLTYMHAWLGDMYRENNQLDKAISQYEKIMELSRKWGKQFLKDLPVYEVLINCYITKGQISKARKLYKEAERNCPNLSYLPLQHVWISFTEKDTAAAIKYYEKYMYLQNKNNPSYGKPDSIGDRGFLYACLGRKDSADVLYRRAYLLDTSNRGAIDWLASELESSAPETFKFDEYSKLIDKLTQSTKDRITYFDLLDRKGWTFYKKGRPEEALEILQKVWNEAPYKFYRIKSHLEEVKKAVAAQTSK